MAIKAKCSSCTNTITVRDEFGGKLVKCPKCTKPMKIPAAQAKPDQNKAALSKSGKQPVAAAKGTKGYNPLLDLLDEAGVESRPSGPVCDRCSAPMSQSAIICIECGYNMATGKQLETAVLIGDEQKLVDDSLTDAQKLLARAEQSLEDTPFTAEGQDFGDGGDSFLIAILAIVTSLVMVAIGVFLILSMDWILEVTGVSSTQISLASAIAMYAGCGGWITVIAFRANPGHGFACLLTAGLYCPIFGFMQGKALIVPSIIMLAATVIGLIAYAFLMYGTEEESLRLINQALQTNFV